MLFLASTHKKNTKSEEKNLANLSKKKRFEHMLFLKVIQKKVPQNAQVRTHFTYNG